MTDELKELLKNAKTSDEVKRLLENYKIELSAEDLEAIVGGMITGAAQIDGANI